MKNFFSNLIRQWHEKGIKIPLLSNHGTGSVSLTLLWLSSIVVIAALFKVGSLNFWESLAWHVTSAVLYYNKTAKISKDGIELSESKAQKPEGEE